MLVIWLHVCMNPNPLKNYLGPNSYIKQLKIIYHLILAWFSRTVSLLSLPPVHLASRTALALGEGGTMCGEGATMLCEGCTM